MKKIITYFIKFPVAVNVLMLSVVVFGFLGLKQMKTSYFPLFPNTTITVTVAYPGASPEEMEEGIVLKIEDNLRGLVGIERFTSVSSENSAVITITTLKDYDINVILAEVKNAVDRVPSFPSDMEPPIIAKREFLDQVINFAVNGEGVDLKTLKKIARQIEDDLRAMDGISQVELSGFPAEEIEIAVRENDLRAYNLTFSEVRLAVAQTNILTTGGNIKTDSEDYLIRANNRAYYGDELDYIVIRADPTGNVIRLRDVATVRDRWSETPDRIFVNGKTGIEIKVSTTNDEEFLEAAEKANKYIENFNLTRDNVQLTILGDRSISLRERTRIMTDNGLLGIIMVLLLLSIFLKPSLAFWVAVGLPISFFGMFIMAGNFVTINIMSLFGMIIVIGILVDDAIVIGENIYAHYEKGKSPIRAAIDGTLEVTPPIVSAILTTVVAFSTFLFLDARIGDFYYEVAIIVILTLLISLVEALIILPAHIAHSRAMNKGSQSFLINKYADQFMNWMRDKLYSPALRFFLENRILAYSIPLAMLILTIGAIRGGIIGLNFFPQISSDRINISLKMPQGTNEQITDSILTMVEASTWVINDEFTERQTDNLEVVQNVVKKIGPGASTGNLTINLLPGETRDFAANEITNSIREKVGEVYGVESLIFGSGGSFSGKPIQVSLIGSNIQQLKGAKEELKAKLRQMPELKDIADNDPDGIKEIKLKLKENAYLLGLTFNDVMSQVRAGFFGQAVQRFQRGRDEIRVWVRYDRENRQSIKNLDDMRIVTPSRERVPLSEIASYNIERGEVSINHLDGVREIQVNAEMKNPADDSAADLLGLIQSDFMPEIVAKFPTVSPLYEGQNREANKVGASTGKILPVILILMYMIIAFTFRSFSQPLLLFVMIPFSLIGVGWGHWLLGYQVTVLSALGIVALIGILVNDGLVLIGKFNSFLKEGMHFKDALYEAGRSRFRAIFLTSITTVAGLGPLIFEKARTAQFIIPMAISIAFGIIVATFLTLFMLPLLLYLSNSIKRSWKWLLTGNRPEREAVERAIIEQKTEYDEMVEA